MERKLHELAAGLPETDLSFEEIGEKERLQERKLATRGFQRVLAACIVLVLCVSLGVVAYRAEAQEYADALIFFQANGLSVEGLTRAEIKAVYKDIKTKSFTFSKTGQVIQNSLTKEQIEGFDILQPEPTPEDVENLWNYKQHGAWFVPYEHPAYMIQVETVWDSTGTVRLDSKYYIERSENGNAVKLAYVPFLSGSFYPVSDGVMVLGSDSYRDENNIYKTDAWILKISNKGQILWIHKLDNGFNQEYPEGVLENADGSYTLFSRGDKEYLCFSRYASDGKRVDYKQTYMGTFGVGQVVHYGDGYLLQVVASEENEAVRFIRVDQQGNVTEGFSYYDEEYVYRVQDMVEHEGKVYISAYSVPKLSEDEATYGGRSEIARILQYVFGQEKTDISNEKLTTLVRANYKAVLLVCDPENDGKMETFYRVSGSLGSDLIVTQEGQLIWETESITDTFYSPATSSFTIGGQCYVYQYIFDAQGNMVSLGRTDRVTNFRR